MTTTLTRLLDGASTRTENSEFVVVEPNTSARLADEAILSDNPRVTAIDATAKNALNEVQVYKEANVRFES